eukprot:9073197-Pyramimonas_sp.AAC.1
MQWELSDREPGLLQARWQHRHIRVASKLRSAFLELGYCVDGQSSIADSRAPKMRFCKPSSECFSHF